MNENTGHGHVRARPDGVKMRCGGPGICAECSLELAAQMARDNADSEKAAASVRRPCPFCGLVPPLCSVKRGEWHFWYHRCGCGVESAHHPSAEAAEHAWNNRKGERMEQAQAAKSYREATP